MYATDFEFDGKRLSDFGCVLTSLDGSRDGPYPSGADISLSTATTSGSDRFDLFGSRYEQPYSTSFSIMKNPCENSDQEDLYFTPREISSIQRWLCRRSRYGKFKVDSDGYRDIYWMGSFTSQQYEISSNVIGFSLTFTADSPYAYVEDVTINMELSSDNSFTLYSIADEEGYIYPNINLTINESGDLIIENDRDTKDFEIKNCTSGEIITINGKYLVISSSIEDHDLGNDCNYCFPRIFNTYDDTRNIYTSNIACSISMSYAPSLKVGL